jgi:hypothetical protein
MPTFFGLHERERETELESSAAIHAARGTLAVLITEAG